MTDTYKQQIMKEFDREFAVESEDMKKTYICDFDKQETIDLYEPIKQFLSNAIDQTEERVRGEIVEKLSKKAKGKVENSYKQFRGLFADGYKLASSSMKAEIDNLNKKKENTP